MIASVLLAVALLLLTMGFVTVEEALARRIMGGGEPEGEVALADPEAAINVLRLLGIGAVVGQVTVVVHALASRDWPAWAVALAAAVDAVLLFVVAEAVPRTLGITRTERVLAATRRPLGALLALAPFRWVAGLGIATANAVVPGAGLRRGPFASPEEFMALADVAVSDEVLEPDERDLIESVLEFGTTIVREVMVPRTDMTVIGCDETVAEGLERAGEAGFSRLPVVGESADDVKGLVYVKDLIAGELADRADEPVTGWLRDARFLPETKRVNELLREMQRDSFHMAIVVDEYGGIAGLVTLEDLIEELVGEIVDEYDKEEPLVERLSDGTLRVDARIPIDELNDLAGLTLPEGDWDTVAGLVFDRSGRIPSEGDEFLGDGYLLRVERVQGRRITRIRIAEAEPETVEVAS